LFDTEQVFQQTGQAEFLIAQDTGGLHGVENIIKGKSKIALHTQDVVFACMEYFFNRGIGEELADSGEVQLGQSVDNEVVLWGGIWIKHTCS
jgi:hypothetical protein